MFSVNRNSSTFFNPCDRRLMFTVQRIPGTGFDDRVCIFDNYVFNRIHVLVVNRDRERDPVTEFVVAFNIRRRLFRIKFVTCDRQLSINIFDVIVTRCITNSCTTRNQFFRIFSNIHCLTIQDNVCQRVVALQTFHSYLFSYFGRIFISRITFTLDLTVIRISLVFCRDRQRRLRNCQLSDNIFTDCIVINRRCFIHMDNCPGEAVGSAVDHVCYTVRPLLGRGN